MDEGQHSIWDEEPRLLCWKVATWEHAALHPKSFGAANRVRESERLLPEEMTAPIYAALTEWEQTILRLTEPLPPLQARLLRDTKCPESVSEQHPVLAMRIADVVPNWESRVTEALGARLDKVSEDIRNFASQGIPRNDFSISYGYRIKVSVISGRDADPKAATHRSLLMGCRESIFQPGAVRDCADALIG